MLKLIKAIKLHRSLRVRQEYVCFRVCEYSQNRLPGTSPFLNELQAINEAVHRIEKKIPDLYFILSDNIFWGGSKLRKRCDKYKQEQEHKRFKHHKEWMKTFSPVCFDLIPSPPTKI